MPLDRKRILAPLALCELCSSASIVPALMITSRVCITSSENHFASVVVELWNQD
jgi:hypothetical protein